MKKCFIKLKSTHTFTLHSGASAWIKKIYPRLGRLVRLKHYDNEKQGSFL
ncbi:hypothetical protein HMPREF0880_04006 [Yokenella regensburgei ATCC 43003]|nr:hypothetical protein HMPREF0880_04006 [Yokenella regensburgei ATCC 43003]